MGVRGLSSFIKDNRQSLVQTVQLDKDGAQSRDKVPVVVDAWGIIFQLYLDSLPWTSGGEYVRFFRLVRRLIGAWRDVGLEPVFVFDGAAPLEKHETLLSRLQKQIRTAQLFYTTSVGSRSSPNFNRWDTILPPLASHTFMHALRSLAVEAHFVAMGEADGATVALAEKLGAYVLGLDSDFAILISGAGVNKVQGYCPLDMMSWIEGAPETAAGPSKKIQASGWETATTSRKSGPPVRQSTFLPSANLQSPTLVLSVVSPCALSQRLRLPASVLPLFASLAGNDYVPSLLAEYLFDTPLDAPQRIEKVARILREQMFAPGMKTNNNPGDQAVELVTRVMKKLCVKPFGNEQEMMDMVNVVMEATFQYIVPPTGDCCSIFPFCGELEPLGCQSSRSRLLSPETDGTLEKSGITAAREAYARSQRRGLLGSITHAWLYPDRVYLWAVLEDPSGPSLKGTDGLRDLRRTHWAIAEEGLGGMRWPGPTAEEMKIVHEDETLQALLALNVGSDPSLSSEETRSNGSTLISDGSDEKDNTAYPGKRPREITEYLRQGSSGRLIPVKVLLPPLSERSTPLVLAPLDVRLHAYLRALQSDTESIRALPAHLHPLVAAIRLSIIESSLRTSNMDSRKWRPTEVEPVLKACLGAFSAWNREASMKRFRPTVATDAEGLYPPLTTRNAMLIAQLSAVMTDALSLAQALLLLPDPVAGADTGTPPLTHMTPFLFFSGVSLHCLLSDMQAPSASWRWTHVEERVYERCLNAITTDLPEGAIYVWSRQGPKFFPAASSIDPGVSVESGPASSDQGEAEQADPTERDGDKQSDEVEAAKRKPRKKKVVKKESGELGKGRFEILTGMTA